MSTPTVPTVPTTGFGWKLGVKLKGGSGNFVDLPWLNKLTPPKRNIDGADAGTLSGGIDQDTPTRPKLDFSGTMWIVDGDAGFLLMDASCVQAPISYLTFQLTSPWGSTKTIDGWLSQWEKSELDPKANRSVDFTVSVTTPEVDAAAQSS